MNNLFRRLSKSSLSLCPVKENSVKENKLIAINLSLGIYIYSHNIYNQFNLFLSILYIY